MVKVLSILDFPVDFIHHHVRDFLQAVELVYAIAVVQLKGELYLFLYLMAVIGRPDHAIRINRIVSKVCLMFLQEV